eukprot:gene6619-17620_t
MALFLFLHSSAGYDGWSNLQGANYVPSYARNDIYDIFTSKSWNATVVDRELGYAKTLAVTSLRVFVTYGAYMGDSKPDVFLENYQTFQRMMKAHGLSLMVTLAGHAPSCANTTDFVGIVVGSEVRGVVIAYEADNEPAPWYMDYVKNCTLPALLKASRNPDVDISVGFAHWGEVSSMADM